MNKECLCNQARRSGRAFHAKPDVYWFTGAGLCRVSLRSTRPTTTITTFNYGGFAAIKSQAERVKLLNQTAIQQMKLLLADTGVRRLEGKQP